MPKNNEPLASIIIPVRNNGRTIEKVIDSVFKQDYKNKEVIIINDCSTDDTLDKIEKHKLRKKFKLIKTKENLGFVRSLNKGIKNSNGEIIATLLGDCWAESNDWLRLLIEPFKNKEIIASTPIVKYPKWLWDKFDPFTKKLTKGEVGLRLTNLNQKGVAYRRDVLFKVGLFDEKIFRNFGEDFDMIAKLNPLGKTYHGTKGIIIHDHPLDREEIIRKSRSYGKSYGVLFRVHGLKLWKLKGGLLRVLFPFWAIAKYFKSYRDTKDFEIFNFLLRRNFIYSVNFIKGFFTRKWVW
jgi:glycosyltransferase involved in cell wall biosynthesis